MLNKWLRLRYTENPSPIGEGSIQDSNFRSGWIQEIYQREPMQYRIAEIASVLGGFSIAETALRLNEGFSALRHKRRL